MNLTTGVVIEAGEFGDTAVSELTVVDTSGSHNGKVENPLPDIPVPGRS